MNFCKTCGHLMTNHNEFGCDMRFGLGYCKDCHKEDKVK